MDAIKSINSINPNNNFKQLSFQRKPKTKIVISSNPTPAPLMSKEASDAIKVAHFDSIRPDTYSKSKEKYQAIQEELSYIKFNLCHAKPLDSNSSIFVCGYNPTLQTSTWAFTSNDDNDIFASHCTISGDEIQAKECYAIDDNLNLKYYSGDITISQNQIQQSKGERWVYDKAGKLLEHSYRF